MTKKVLCTALAIFGFAVHGIAQEKGNIEMGANLGLNFASVRYEGNETDNRTGLNAGVSGEYYFSDRLSIKTKVSYDRKGWSNGWIAFEDDSNKIKTDYNLDYITIPVMVGFHFGGKRGWYLQAGPYVGFLINAKDTKFQYDVKGLLNTTDFGAALGIGYKFRVAENLKLFVEYDEHVGMINIAKSGDGTIFRNSRGAFNLGVNVMLK